MNDKKKESIASIKIEKIKIKNQLMNNNSCENSPNFILKPRSYSFDIKNSKIKSIKINKDNIRAFDNTTRGIENKIFFNTSNLPKIIHKLSLSNQKLKKIIMKLLED